MKGNIVARELENFLLVWWKSLTFVSKSSEKRDNVSYEQGDASKIRSKFHMADRNSTSHPCRTM